VFEQQFLQMERAKEQLLKQSFAMRDKLFDFLDPSSNYSASNSELHKLVIAHRQKDVSESNQNMATLEAMSKFFNEAITNQAYFHPLPLSKSHMLLGNFAGDKDELFNKIISLNNDHAGRTVALRHAETSLRREFFLPLGKTVLAIIHVPRVKLIIQLYVDYKLAADLVLTGGKYFSISFDHLKN
jgi:hypothetical protein